MGFELFIFLPINISISETEQEAVKTLQLSSLAAELEECTYGDS